MSIKAPEIGGTAVWDSLDDLVYGQTVSQRGTGAWKLMVATIGLSLITTACTSSSAERAAQAPDANESAISSEPATPSDSPTERDASTSETVTENAVDSDEVSESQSSEPVQGLFKPTRVCVKNLDEVGVWRNYVQWDRKDSDTGVNPKYGETVCATGSFINGDDIADVVGRIYLRDRRSDSEIEIKFKADNKFEPWEDLIMVEGKGTWTEVSSPGGPSKVTISAAEAGAPRRLLTIERLPETRNKEFQITITAPQTCAEQGPCALGDTGPGGGVVIYDAGSQKAWGRYLEVAPVGWDGNTTELRRSWCPTWDRGYKTELNLGTAIGDGARNTVDIQYSCGVDSAAKAASSYRGGGKSDWFLPSKDELIAVWNAKELASIIDQDASAWSSSQVAGAADKAWKVKLAKYVGKNNLDTSGAPKDAQHIVRPIRAF